VFLGASTFLMYLRRRLPDRLAAYVKYRATGVGQATNDMVNRVKL
jgi:hypothetical protein